MNKIPLVALTAVVGLTAAAKVELGAPFTDGVVLQRGVKCPVWGTATPGNSVEIEFAGQSVSATADENGKWRAYLEPMVASSINRLLRATEYEPGWLCDSKVDAVVVKNVLVGEVWFASGQSNMDCPLWGGNTRYRDGNGSLVAAMANQPLVRHCTTPIRWSKTPLKLKANWCPMTSKAQDKIKQISAVGYYFARELHLALGVPVGLIDSSWGGTNIDAWTPRCGWEGKPELKCVSELPIFDAEHKADFQASLSNGVHASYIKQYAAIYGDAKNPRPMQQPTVIWNAMVQDYAPFACKGFIWYQGCHNSGEPQLYCAKMHALYDGWKQEFENPGLKLYFVQLAPFRSNWNKTVDAQNQFASEEPNAAISVISDHGNFDDIHPNEKEIVAKRLAVHALKRDYGFPIEDDDSPICTKVDYADGKATLSFAHAKRWYVYNDNRSKEAPFQLAGKDGVWHPAKIVNWHKDGKGKLTDHILGNQLVLQSDKVAEPVKVGYMREKGTAGCMFNELTLPLGPFEK